MTDLPKTDSKEPSVVFITMHKAGSVLVNQVLEELLLEAGMPHIDFARYAFDSGIKEGDYCVSKAHLLSTPGYYFGAFRGPYLDKFDDLSKNRLIIQVRDPRDCIVSLYFSYKYSHSKPGNGILKSIFNSTRKKTRNTDVNKFAMENIGNYDYRMKIISATLDRYQNHLLITYEQMVQDFDAWLNTIIKYLALDPGEECLDKIRNLANFEVLVENVAVHKRQVTPGDYQRKLDPVVQQTMTEMLQIHLQRYGYV